MACGMALRRCVGSGAGVGAERGAGGDLVWQRKYDTAYFSEPDHGRIAGLGGVGLQDWFGDLNDSGGEQHHCLQPWNHQFPLKRHQRDTAQEFGHK